MDESELLGTEVLERLAEVGKVEEFYDAVDADNFQAIRALMRSVGVDAQTIEIIMERIHNP